MSLEHEQDEKNYTGPEVSVSPASNIISDDELAVTHEGDHGTRRDLKPRVVSMIAIAGTIGTGLFLGSGSALALGGPVGAWLGYTIMGALVGCMMYCLGEMTCFAPNIGGFVEMGTRYVSPQWGFMMGINYILQTGMAIPSELSAIAVMISFWDDSASHAGIYIAVFLLVAIGTNVIGVRYYGEIEFGFACLKVATLVGLIIFGLIANLGGIPPNHEYIGGRYWRDEPFNDTFKNLQPVSKARFLGFWAVFTKAAFSYGGIESIGVLAGEAHNPRRTMRMAVRTVFYRIIGIYMLAILIIGLNVSQKSPDLLSAVAGGGKTAASSPFVVICKQTGVKVLPSIINAVVMTSALSSCNENIYAVSRTLMALARNGSMPRWFLKTNKAGIPFSGVIIGFCFALLAFLSLSAGSNKAFSWLSNLSALSSLVGWICICYCYVCFKKACDVQGIDRHRFPLRSWFQPYLAWVCIIFFSLVLIFNGFTAFIGGFAISDFFASYVTLPLIGLCYLAFKLIRKTRSVRAEDIDLSRGPAEALWGTKYDQSSNSGHVMASPHDLPVVSSTSEKV